jgi:UDP-N-acetylglucosamine 2-epimerase (non-hydrolysing)
MLLKIINIVAARPNLRKIAPLIREMRCQQEIDPILVRTGQRYGEALADIFFRQTGIPTPQVDLEFGSGLHASQTDEVLKGLKPFLPKNPPLAPTEKAPYLLRNNSRTGPSKRLAPKDSFHYAGT